MDSPTLATQLIARLRQQANPVNVAGQMRFGIRPRTELLGLSMVQLRDYAKSHRGNQSLALALWAHPIHEAQLLAALTADPNAFTPDLMDAWIRDFDTWDICDQVCLNVFRRSPHAFARVSAWADREPEFERRAAFALLATLAVHAKKEPDKTFLALLPFIDKAASDERNFVKKAVNWALRQIGKRRSETLHTAALDLAEDLSTRESKSARWIGKDALRELTRRQRTC